MLLLIVLLVCSSVPFSLGQDEQLLLQTIQTLHEVVIEEVLQETLSEEGGSVYRELRDNSTTDNSTNVVCSLCLVMYSCFRLLTSSSSAADAAATAAPVHMPVFPFEAKY